MIGSKFKLIACCGVFSNLVRVWFLASKFSFVSKVSGQFGQAAKIGFKVFGLCFGQPGFCKIILASLALPFFCQSQSFQNYRSGLFGEVFLSKRFGKSHFVSC